MKEPTQTTDLDLSSINKLFAQCKRQITALLTFSNRVERGSRQPKTMTVQIDFSNNWRFLKLSVLFLQTGPDSISMCKQEKFEGILCSTIFSTLGLSAVAKRSVLTLADLVKYVDFEPDMEGAKLLYANGLEFVQPLLTERTLSQLNEDKANRLFQLIPFEELETLRVIEQRCEDVTDFSSLLQVLKEVANLYEYDILRFGHWKRSTVLDFLAVLTNCIIPTNGTYTASDIAASKRLLAEHITNRHQACIQALSEFNRVFPALV